MKFYSIFKGPLVMVEEFMQHFLQLNLSQGNEIEKFFERSSSIYSMIFVSIMNLDTCQMIELPFERFEK